MWNSKINSCKAWYNSIYDGLDGQMFKTEYVCWNNITKLAKLSDFRDIDNT